MFTAQTSDAAPFLSQFALVYSSQFVVVLPSQFSLLFLASYKFKLNFEHTATLLHTRGTTRG